MIYSSTQNPAHLLITFSASRISSIKEDLILLLDATLLSLLPSGIGLKPAEARWQHKWLSEAARFSLARLSELIHTT